MSLKYDFEKNYKDVDFTESELKTIKTQFLGFSDWISLSNNIFKRNFKRVFLIPALWQFLISALFFIIIGLSLFGSVLNMEPAKLRTILDRPGNEASQVSLNQNRMIDRSRSDLMRPGDELYPESDYNNTIMTNRSYENSAYADLFFGTASTLFLFLFGSLVLVILILLIRYRQMYILNSKSISGIWKTPRGFYMDLLKFIAIGIIQAIISLVAIFVVSGVLSVFNLAWLSGIVVIIAMTGYFGLVPHLVIYEQADVFVSLSTSFKLVNTVFWKNLGRWFILILIYLVVGLIFGFLSNFLLLSVVSASISSGNLSSLVGFLIFYQIVSVIITLVFSSYYLSVDYVSYLNIRLYRGEILAKSEKENELEVKTSETHDKVKELDVEKTVDVSEKAEESEPKKSPVKTDEDK